MEKKYEVLVVVLNYKTAEMTIQCLEAIQGELSPLRRVIVVDNDSQDGSYEKISLWIESSQNDYIEVLDSGSNLGFSGGNNVGIKHKSAEFYLLLNSDTLVREGAVETLVNTAKEFPESGIVSPRLEWPDGRPQISCFRFHTPVSQFINVAATSHITKVLNSWDVPIPLTESISKPQWTSFACVLVKSSLIEDIGLMDDKYFLYFEDADYCHQAANHRWEIVNNPKARVVHLRGGSSTVKENISKKKRLPKYYYQSRTRYFIKNYSYLGYIAANLMWIAARFISKSRELLGKKSIPVCEYEYRDIWTSESK